MTARVGDKSLSASFGGRFYEIIIALACGLCIGSVQPSWAQSSQRSGAGPCRQGVLALIAMLDRAETGTQDYRSSYRAVVESCGPVAVAPVPAKAPSGAEACSKLAVAMLDAIEDGKINSRRFAEARGRFAQACPPR